MGRVTRGRPDGEKRPKKQVAARIAKSRGKLFTTNRGSLPTTDRHHHPQPGDFTRVRGEDEGKEGLTEVDGSKGLAEDEQHSAEVVKGDDLVNEEGDPIRNQRMIPLTAVMLQPVLFELDSHASHASAAIVYLSKRINQAEVDEDEFITQPPVKRVSLTCVQTLFTGEGDDEREVGQEILRRNIVEEDGITVEDVLEVMAQVDRLDVARIRTEFGPNTYLEIPGVVVVEAGVEKAENLIEPLAGRGGDPGGGNAD